MDATGWPNSDLAFPLFQRGLIAQPRTTGSYTGSCTQQHEGKVEDWSKKEPAIQTQKTTCTLRGKELQWSTTHTILVYNLTLISNMNQMQLVT